MFTIWQLSLNSKNYDLWYLNNVVSLPDQYENNIINIIVTEWTNLCTSVQENWIIGAIIELLYLEWEMISEEVLDTDELWDVAGWEEVDENEEEDVNEESTLMITLLCVLQTLTYVNTYFSSLFEIQDSIFYTNSCEQSNQTLVVSISNFLFPLMNWLTNTWLSSLSTPALLIWGVLGNFGYTTLQYLYNINWDYYANYYLLAPFKKFKTFSKILKFAYDMSPIIITLLLAYITNILLYNEYCDEAVSSWSSFLLVVYFISFVFYLFKYSVHFFSFLELSVTDMLKYKYLLKQFIRDISNFLAHILRLNLLFLRLNIYDGLDDVLDSYYLFVGDFNIYDFQDMTWIYLLILYFTENTFDVSVLMNEENEILTNVYYFYLVIFLKIFFFLFFILEGVLRLSLAVYIIILLTLEINSFNVMCIETKNTY